MLFEDGATVSIGGVAATNVNVVDPATITATTPALPAGTLNAVTVSNPSGTAGTLPQGWIANFSDVPNAHQFYFHIIKLVANGITAGCATPGAYCPLASVTRAQMAVFLMKSKNGQCFVPPACTRSLQRRALLEPLRSLDRGARGRRHHRRLRCGGGNYCPNNPVLRQQMAVFLLKALHGSTFVPPHCNGDFVDVPCPATRSPTGSSSSRPRTSREAAAATTTAR